MNKLYLIRHGQTRANLEHLYCGSTDLPLCEEGGQALKQLRYDLPADCLYVTSGMKRTEETLFHLFGDIPHQIDRRFRETDFGLFEMKSYRELKDRPDYQAWISGDNEKNIPPEGESGEMTRLRVLEGLSHLQGTRRDILLVAHGGVIALIMAHLFPEENKNRYQWQPLPGCGYLICEGRFFPIPKTE